MNKSLLYYYFIRTITYPLAFLPYRAIHILGKIIGTLCYYLLTEYRKIALSNLSLAVDLNIKTEKELISTAKKSFQNLAINILEYPKLSREKDFSKIITCLNPEKAQDIYKSKNGIIFFCGHQANWEVLFLDGNLRMKGTAIAKDIKNHKLNDWLVSIREKTGGRIISSKKAMREGLNALKRGEFLGIVGDQGMPSSNYSFPFFGRKAWNSTAPALLSYKTGCPIIVATTKREKGKYFITYSDPIWPQNDLGIDKEIKNLMDKSLEILQSSIKEKPDQWLWQHNRWKQQTPHLIRKQFRHDSICIILPEDASKAKYIADHLPSLKKFYTDAFTVLYIPEKFPKNTNQIKVDEIKRYKSLKQILINDYRVKLIFTFSDNKKIKKHYKKLSAFEIVTMNDLLKITKKECPDKNIEDLSELFISSICKSTAL